jgi:hypothetical protein
MKNKVEDIRKLLQLRNMRVDLAKIAVQQAYAVVMSAKQTVKECQATLMSYAKDIETEHQLMRENPGLYAVRFLGFTEVRINRLKARAERTYTQLREAIAEEEKSTQLHRQSITMLMQAVARRDGVAEQSRKINQQAMLAAEELQLLELADMPRLKRGNAR